MVPANRQVYDLTPLGYFFDDLMSILYVHVVLHTKTFENNFKIVRLDGY